MALRVGSRILISALLLLLVAALCVGFSAGVRDADATRASDRLDTDYESFHGETVHFWGRVHSVDPLVVTTDGTRLVVTGDGAGASPGDVVQVAGTAEPDHQIAATRVVVSDRVDRQRMFAVSLLAPLVALLIGWRRWTVRPADWRLASRDA